jgi:hypothetical protein
MGNSSNPLSVSEDGAVADILLVAVKYPARKKIQLFYIAFS